MILLRLISLPYARKHLLRTLLTVAGIVLGIAVFVAMNIANLSVLGAFNRTVDRISGATQLQVSAGEAGFDEDILERVQAVKGVRVAVPVIEAVADTGIQGQGNLLILAVDMTGDRSLRDYDVDNSNEDAVEDPLVFLAQPDSLLITSQFASRNGIVSGAKLPMQTMDGLRQFIVRGIMKSGGLATAFGGNLAVMDIYAAQKVFGRGRKFDRVDLAVDETATVEQVRSELQKLLGPGFEVEPPSSRGKHFESLLHVYSMTINLSSWFALFIGMFIIYNSFSIAVTQRRGEIGILRALGATSGQIRTLFLGESAMLGVIGSATGIVVGIFAAKALTGQMSQMLEALFGVMGKPEEVTWTVGLLGSAMAIGIATSMIAALVPARNASRVDPVKALQKGRYQVIAAGESEVRKRLAFLSVAGAAASLIFSGNRAIFYSGYLLLISAALLLTPFLALWIARGLRLLLKLLRPVEGALAADSVIQAPRRTSATVAALMLSLAMVTGLAGMARASYSAIMQWMDTTLNPDLFVSTSGNLSTRSFRFPPSLGPELETVEGVETVQAVRSLKVTVGGTPIMLIAIPMASIAQRTPSRHVVAGDYAEMHRLAAQEKGVIISENLALLQKIPLGAMLALPTPSGILHTPVAGILRDYSGQQGTIFIDREVYIRHWKDDTVDLYRLYVRPGVNTEQLKERILTRFASQKRLFVLLNRDVRKYVLDITDQWFAMSYVQIAIAVLVAILGIVNTLTVSIADRRRELGVLRAVGGLRSQIRITIWLEALTIGAVGLIMGLGAGSIVLAYLLEMIRHDFSGMPLDYAFPWTVAAALIPVMLGSALIAAIGPGESAIRGPLVEALEYE
ncbi:MAG: FtsX-like permease family protein [Bryobacteraceae bacterium]